MKTSKQYVCLPLLTWDDKVCSCVHLISLHLVIWPIQLAVTNTDSICVQREDGDESVPLSQIFSLCTLSGQLPPGYNKVVID